MNLTDLSRLDVKDIKNINYQKLFEDIKKRPDIIVNVFVVCLTLFICVRLISGRQEEIKSLKSDIEKMEEKVNIIDDYQSTKKEMDEYLSRLPQYISEDALVNYLTDLAEKRHIQIESISPSRTTKGKLHESTSISLDIAAKEYKDVWLFVHDIEKSPYAMRFDNWVGYMSGGSGPKSKRSRTRDLPGSAETILIHVTVKISSIHVETGKT